MNAVEIEEALSALAEQPFEGTLPLAFLQAFGHREPTLKRVRKPYTRANMFFNKDL